MVEKPVEDLWVQDIIVNVRCQYLPPHLSTHSGKSPAQSLQGSLQLVLNVHGPEERNQSWEVERSKLDVPTAKIIGIRNFNTLIWLLPISRSHASRPIYIVWQHIIVGITCNLAILKEAFLFDAWDIIHDWLHQLLLRRLRVKTPYLLLLRLWLCVLSLVLRLRIYCVNPRLLLGIQAQWLRIFFTIQLLLVIQEELVVFEDLVFDLRQLTHDRRLTSPNLELLNSVVFKCSDQLIANAYDVRRKVCPLNLGLIKSLLCELLLLLKSDHSLLELD